MHNKPTTHKVFQFCSWMCVSLMCFFAFLASPLFALADTSHIADIALRFLGTILGIAGAPAALLLIFGMAIDCIREERLTHAAKTIWFIAFITTAFLGASMYFFFVYAKRFNYLEAADA